MEKKFSFLTDGLEELKKIIACTCDFAIFRIRHDAFLCVNIGAVYMIFFEDNMFIRHAFVYRIRANLEVKFGIR